VTSKASISGKSGRRNPAARYWIPIGIFGWTPDFIMQVIETEIADIKLLTPVRHVDSRGFFSEVFRANSIRASS